MKPAGRLQLREEQPGCQSKAPEYVANSLRYKGDWSQRLAAGVKSRHCRFLLDTKKAASPTYEEKHAAAFSCKGKGKEKYRGSLY